jgi:predicted N-acetyltransferase YhbS
MTLDRYRQVMDSWPYRPELDWMIEISDGHYVANTCVWYDELNGVALLEPLGVDPAFRRQGLARAVALQAMHAARDVGAKRAIVYPRGDELYPFTKPLYLGLGFRPYAQAVSFVKRR